MELQFPSIMLSLFFPGSPMLRPVTDYLADALNRFANSLLVGSTTSNRRSRSCRAPQNGSVTYEACEQRRMLAGVLFDAATGEITIGGTNDADIALVTQVNGVVTVTHEGFATRSFAASDVNSILFVGLAGDDRFENRTAIAANAFGQLGNDTLIGGSGADQLLGNNGDDIIVGNGGDDVLVAGNGDDNVNAGAGNDLVIGVRGFNIIEGGTGDDELFGGLDTDIITDVNGTNVLVGFDGDDTITGGSGEDVIFGGSGDDVINGNEGDDQIFGQEGNDSLIGGFGADLLNGNDGDDVLEANFNDNLIIGAAGNDLVNLPGSLADFNVTGTADTVLIFENLSLDDLSSASGEFAEELDIVHTVLTAEQFSFSDGATLSPQQVLNPAINSPLANARQVVTVQPIVASNTDGSNQAPSFGNAAQEAFIKNRIDEIYAQADIDVEFLPTRFVNDTFTNVGNGGRRSGFELFGIEQSGDAKGIGSSDPNVIDLYFLDVAPAFDDTVPEFTTVGVGGVGANISAVQVGDNALNSDFGRERIALAIAHEIGHNLGLGHTSQSGNLLTPTGEGILLNAGQVSTSLNSSFSRPITGATLAQLESPREAFLQQATLSSSNDNAQADTTSSTGGCGGCGFCIACTGALLS